VPAGAASFYISRTRLCSNVFINFDRLNTDNKYQAVIGLEVHAQLSTSTKLFCGDRTSFGAPPNTQVSPISIAVPGSLPKMNKKVIELATRLGIAMNCEIVRENYFARKHYFYPDLPKGYQVSQHTAPICKGGGLEITTTDGTRNIRLNRIHMEEDAGKSIHDLDPEHTCIDLNRAGMPLLEIVTEPDIHSSEEAFQFLTSLRKLVRWLDVCDGNMEEGSMRCDANISIRPKGSQVLGTRVEIKNLNSIRNVKKAIDLEVARLVKITEAGEKIIQETRSYNADENTSFSLRSKEEADDYRYFPEPDLPAFHISEAYISDVRLSMPELPGESATRLMNDFGLSDYDASRICSDKSLIDMFEKLAANTRQYKATANWINGPVFNWMNEKETGLESFPIPVLNLSKLIILAESGKISFNNAVQKLFPVLLESMDTDPEKLASDLNLFTETDSSAIETWVDEAIERLPQKVIEYRSGKKGLLGLFAGEVKKISKGKADMAAVNKLLTEKLNKV